MFSSWCHHSRLQCICQCQPSPILPGRHVITQMEFCCHWKHHRDHPGGCEEHVINKFTGWSSRRVGRAAHWHPCWQMCQPFPHSHKLPLRKPIFKKWQNMIEWIWASCSFQIQLDVSRRAQPNGALTAFQHATLHKLPKRWRLRLQTSKSANICHPNQ